MTALFCLTFFILNRFTCVLLLALCMIFAKPNTAIAANKSLSVMASANINLIQRTGILIKDGNARISIFGRRGQIVLNQADSLKLARQILNRVGSKKQRQMTNQDLVALLEGKTLKGSNGSKRFKEITRAHSVVLSSYYHYLKLFGGY